MTTDLRGATRRRCGCRLRLAGSACTPPRATQLDVELTRTGADTFRLYATDPTGAPVITIDTVTVRAVPEGIGQPAPVASGDSVFELTWPPVPETSTGGGRQPGWAVVTEDPDQLPAVLRGGRDPHRAGQRGAVSRSW